MPMSASEIEKRIKAAIPDAVVEVRDLAGDDNHWAATVISEQFRGKTACSSTRSSMQRSGRTWGRRCIRSSVQTKAPD